jgi:hypothetical protein
MLSHLKLANAYSCISVTKLTLTTNLHVHISGLINPSSGKLQFVQNDRLVDWWLICKTAENSSKVEYTVFARVISAPAYFAHPNF